MVRNLDAAKGHHSFISYQPLAGNLTFIKEKGIEVFAKLENEKIAFLKELLESYDDGRSKGFLCSSCQLLPLDNLKDTVNSIKDRMLESADVKERARVVRAAISELAETLGVSLKLRI